MIEHYNIQTPTLLFPAISLMMLAYTNRFLGITQVIRKLHADLKADPTQKTFFLAQINSLSNRIHLIIKAQKSGILSITFCVVSMIMLLFSVKLSFLCFCGALFAMLASLGYIFKELTISKEALEFILEDCQNEEKRKKLTI